MVRSGEIRVGLTQTDWDEIRLDDLMRWIRCDKMRLDKTESDEMRPGGMKWIKIKWNQITLDEIRGELMRQE